VNQTFEARSIFHQLKTEFQFRLKSALWLSVSAVQGTELSAFCSALVSHVPERLISSFTKPKTLISSSGERLALSVLIWNLITQSPRLPFCQLPVIIYNSTS